MRIQSQRGALLVELVAASALVLLLLAASATWMLRLTREPASVTNRSTALNAARLELERQVATTAANGTAYGAAVQSAPTVSGAVAGLPGGTYTVTRSLRTANLFDITVQVAWQESGGRSTQVTLFTSVWKR